MKEPYGEIALQPNTPRVSDILAWLSSLESVQKNPSLKLENISYTYVTNPTREKPKERYSIRVDLEFSCPSNSRAREFYDVLNAPNPFVDPKVEIKWTAQRGRYYASFFLKDLTQYP